MTLACAWSGLGRSIPIQNWNPVRPPLEQTLVWELWPSTPQLASTRSVYPSSPGRPMCTMISLRRFCVIAARIRAASASSASSQLTRSHRPLPRGPDLFIGYRIRSGSVTWLIVAGPLAQLRPREPGCSGLPSNLRTCPVWRST